MQYPTSNISILNSMTRSTPNDMRSDLGHDLQSLLVR